MTKYYFSVDVETTSTNLFDGQLLTIGAVTINAETLEQEGEIYLTVDYDHEIFANEDTLNWWHSDAVSDEALFAAWSKDIRRLNRTEAAEQLQEWVNGYGVEWSDRIFAANPVSFDFPWIQKLYAETGLENPFHYRTLCMRSMYFGIVGGEWGGNRGSTGEWHSPEVPHHALSDAYAQAKDLVQMIEMQKRNNAILNTKDY